MAETAVVDHSAISTTFFSYSWHRIFFSGEALS